MNLYIDDFTNNMFVKSCRKPGRNCVIGNGYRIIFYIPKKLEDEGNVILIKNGENIAEESFKFDSVSPKVRLETIYAHLGKIAESAGLDIEFEHAVSIRNLVPDAVSIEGEYAASGYSVTANGDIYTGWGNPVEIHINKDGYFYVNIPKSMLVSDGTTPALVHRIVAETFIPNESHLPVVNHLNGVKTDNRAENLRWISKKEVNQRDQRGEGSAVHKYTEEQIREVKRLLKLGYGTGSITKATGVKSGTISQVRQGKQWTNIV